MNKAMFTSGLVQQSDRNKLVQFANKRKNDSRVKLDEGGTLKPLTKRHATTRTDAPMPIDYGHEAVRAL